MKHLKSLVILGSASAMLAACNSTTSSQSQTTPILSAVALSAAQGSGNGLVTATELQGLDSAIEPTMEAIDNGTLTAPSAPPGTAELNGYIAIEGLDDDELVVGNLTLDVNFAQGTVASTADGFAEFDFDDPDNPVAITNLDITGGALTGNGTATNTGFTSTLDGTVTTSTAGNFVFDADLNGNFYDDNGSIFTTGEVSGTSNGETIDAGETMFLASE